MRKVVDFQQSALLSTQKPTNVRGSILIGEEDQGCLGASRYIVEIMRAHGLACELEIIPGLGHEYPADFSEHVARELEFIAQR